MVRSTLPLAALVFFTLMQKKMFYTFIYYTLDIGIMLTVLSLARSFAQKWKGMVITCTALCSSGMQLMLNILAVPAALDHMPKLLLKTHSHSKLNYPCN